MEGNVHLTPTEERLLAALRGQRGQTLSREALGAACGSPGRAVDAAVARLRRKLGPAGGELATVHGGGYVWGAPPLPAARSGQRFQVGRAEVDLSRRQARLGARCVRLTTLEAQVLRRLLAAQGEPVGAQELTRGEGAAAKVVLQLRRKLGGAGCIVSHRGAGYGVRATPLDEDRFCGLAWEVAEVAGTSLGLEDVVVYRRSGALLEQVAAFGPKGVHGVLQSPLKLPVGQGIVGAAARWARSEQVADTRSDRRYVQDGREARSELAVPILQGGAVVGVLDSESCERAAYGARHLQALEGMARLFARALGEPG